MTFEHREISMFTAKVFLKDGNQAILLPKEFWVSGREVYLIKTCEGFLAIAKNPWELFREGIEELSDEFFADGRIQPPVQERHTS